MWRRLCRRLVGLLLLTGLWTPARAENELQGYLGQLESFTLRQLPGPTDPSGPLAPFPPGVLEEYGLISHSRWAAAGGEGQAPGFRLEAFEMKNSLAAFGAYSLWPLITSSEGTWERLSLQVDNSYREGELVFWRGSFLFRLTPEVPGSDARPGSLKLATELVDAIPLLNLHPLTLLNLPREGLRRDSIRFYLGEVSLALDPHLPPLLVPRAGFEKDAEVIRAEYGPDRRALFLLGYPTPGVALQYLGELQDGLESYFSPQGVYMKRAGVLLGIFFGPLAEAEPILDQVRYTPTVRWVYQKEVDPEEMRRATLGFLEAIRGTILMVGFFLSVTLAAGVVAGVVRYQVFRSFPGLLRRDDVIFLEFD